MSPSNDHPRTDVVAADLAIVGTTALVAVPAIGRDGAAEFASATTIEITDGAITWIGPSSEPRPLAREVIDASDLVAIPGMINTHCHAAMTFLRGVAEDVPIANWFNDFIWPMEVNVGAHDVYVGTMVAIAEMIESGITTFADHYFFMDEAARAVEETGLRANLCSAFFSSQGTRGWRNRSTSHNGGTVAPMVGSPHRSVHTRRTRATTTTCEVQPTRLADWAYGSTPTPLKTCIRRSSASTAEASRRSRYSMKPECSMPV